MKTEKKIDLKIPKFKKHHPNQVFIYNQNFSKKDINE